MPYPRGLFLVLFLVLACTSAGDAAPVPEGLPAFGHDPGSSGPALGEVSFPSTSLLSRSLEGLRVPLALDWRGRRLGRARLVGGADPAPERPAVAGGLLWRMDTAGGEHLRFGVLNSGIERTGADGGETLALGGVDLALGEPYYLPDISLEYAAMHARHDAPSAMAGAAAGVRLNGRLADGRYRLRVVRADADFRPLGATVVPGRTVAELGAIYPLGEGVSMDVTTRAYRDRLTGVETRGWSQGAALSAPAPALVSAFDRVRIDGSVEARDAGADARHWQIAATGGGLDWRTWVLSGGLDWENRPPEATRAQRYGWLVRGHRPVRVGGFAGRLHSNIALHRLAGSSEQWGVATGVSLRVDRPERDWAVHLDYSADPWAHPVGGDADTRSILLSFGLEGGVTPPPRSGPFRPFRRGARPY